MNTDKPSATPIANVDSDAESSLQNMGAATSGGVVVLDGLSTIAHAKTSVSAYPRLTGHANLYAGRNCIVCGGKRADATVVFEQSESYEITVYYHRRCRGVQGEDLFDACVRRFESVDALISHEGNL